MNSNVIEEVVLDGYSKRGSYCLAKKIDMGSFYFVFVSGVQAPKDSNHRVVTENVEEQTRLVFDDISKILKQAGASIDDVVKAVIYLTDMKDFSIISPIRDTYFKVAKPISTLVEVNRMTRDGAKIEIEVTAVLKK